MGLSTMLSRVNTLVIVGYGEELDPRSGYTNGETRTKSDPRSGYTNNDSSRNTICEAGSMIQEEYINKCNCDFVNEDMGILNRKGESF